MKRTVLALALVGCASATTIRPRVNRVWPAPPAAARVRWLGAFPDADAPAPRRSGWARALDAIAGVDRRAAEPAPPLARPFGVAAVDGGFVVADPDRREVLRVAWPAGTTSRVSCTGRDLVMPLAVAAAPDGTLYVADGGAHVVVRIPRRGACTVIGAGALERPSGVALAAGRVYVVDPPRHAVVAFTPDGARVASFGGRGDAHGPGLNFPTAIAAAPDGALLVVDALNFRVSRFSPDGAWLGSFGEPGDGGGAFGRPKAVAVDPAGRLYVSDAQHDVVLMLAPDGGFELALGGSGRGPGELSLPAGVAVAERFLYVADSYNRRVSVYELLEAMP